VLGIVNSQIVCERYEYNVKLKAILVFHGDKMPRDKMPLKMIFS
jgi:hypothetical protein